MSSPTSTTASLRRIVANNCIPPEPLRKPATYITVTSGRFWKSRRRCRLWAERRYVWGIRYVDNCVLRDRDTTGSGSFNERLYAMPGRQMERGGALDVTGTVRGDIAFTPYGVVTVYDPTGPCVPSRLVPLAVPVPGRRFELLTGCITSGSGLSAGAGEMDPGRPDWVCGGGSESASVCAEQSCKFNGSRWAGRIHVQRKKSGRH